MSAVQPDDCYPRVKERTWIEPYDIIEFINSTPWQHIVARCTITFHIGDVIFDPPPGTLLYFHTRWGYNSGRVTVDLPKPLGNTVLIRGAEHMPQPRVFNQTVVLNHCNLRMTLSDDRMKISFERLC